MRHRLQAHWRSVVVPRDRVARDGRVSLPRTATPLGRGNRGWRDAARRGCQGSACRGHRPHQHSSCRYGRAMSTSEGDGVEAAQIGLGRAGSLIRRDRARARHPLTGSASSSQPSRERDIVHRPYGVGQAPPSQPDPERMGRSAGSPSSPPFDPSLSTVQIWPAWSALTRS
jgi:hypothetical protein